MLNLYEPYPAWLDKGAQRVKVKAHIQVVAVCALTTVGTARQAAFTAEYAKAFAITAYTCCPRQFMDIARKQSAYIEQGKGA